MAGLRSKGYRMPAEWEKHEATWLSWPKDPDTFPGDILPKVEKTYIEMVTALCEGEEVRILVDDAKAEGRVKSMLRGAANVSFHRLRTVDVWVRDYGPIYVVGKGLAVTKWRFNSWGRRYDDLLPDDEAGERMAASSGLPMVRPGMVLEGGSLDVNGKGTLLTTEQCLLNPNRNPGYDKEKIERKLRESLGATNIVWLKSGIEGDDTDGHVDDVARFVDEGTVVAAVERNGSDPNSRALSENYTLLEASKDEEGRRLRVILIPMPPAMTGEGVRLPASHINFYIGNAVVLVPTFGGKSDKAAVSALQEQFSRREVMGVECRALLNGLGTIHCVTQQVPAVG